MAFGNVKLNSGNLHLVTTWDDLYAHLYTLGDGLSKETHRYTGWMAFPI